MPQSTSSNLHWALSQDEHHAVGSQWLCQDALRGHSQLQDNPWLEASQLLKVFLILCSNLVLLCSFCPVALLVSEQSKIWGNWEAVCERKQIKTGHAAACDSGVPFRSSWGIPGNSDRNNLWEQWGVGEAWQESELRKSREYVNRQPLTTPKDLLKLWKSLEQLVGKGERRQKVKETLRWTEWCSVRHPNGGEYLYLLLSLKRSVWAGQKSPAYIALPTSVIETNG